MHFKNFPKIRIAKHSDKGYVVEIQKRKWYGKKYWTHIISVSGIASQPWYFRDEETAIGEACNIFKRMLYSNTFLILINVNREYSEPTIYMSQEHYDSFFAIVNKELKK